MSKRKGKSFKIYISTKKSKEFQVAYDETKMHLKIARLVEVLRIKKGLT